MSSLSSPDGAGPSRNLGLGCIGVSPPAPADTSVEGVRGLEDGNVLGLDEAVWNVSSVGRVLLGEASGSRLRLRLQIEKNKL